MAKLSKASGLILAISFVIWSVILYSFAYSAGISKQKKIYAAKNKPLAASISQSNDAIEFSKATTLAKSKNFDGAIAVLSPEVADTIFPTEQRVQGMILIAQFFQAKNDPEKALQWYLDANKLSVSPTLSATLGAANASGQLYGTKSTGPDGPKGAQSFKQAALEYYNQALGLTTDATIKSQIATQISALNKAQ